MTARNIRSNVLASMPGTASAIAKKLGVTSTGARRWCEALCDDDEAYIGGWYQAPTGGRVTAVYHPGRGVDVARPGDGAPAAPGERVERKEQPRAPLPNPHPLMALFGPR